MAAEQIQKDFFEKILSLQQQNQQYQTQQFSQIQNMLLKNNSLTQTLNSEQSISKNFVGGSQDKPLYKFCVTGGPCSGKTSSMDYFTQELNKLGFQVFRVPEMPTLTMVGGGMIMMSKLTKEEIIKFQTYLMTIQLQIEDYFTKLAQMAHSPAVILCDRGVCDPRAYMNEVQHQTIMDEQNWNKVMLRDKRYNATIYLVTAADGAESFYTSENNKARYEDVPGAIKTDQNTISAWVGAPHLAIIDNVCKGFQEKVERAFSAVKMYIGLPRDNKAHMYLVENFSVPEEIHSENFEIEVTFLESTDKKQIKIVKRGANKSNAYFYVEKTVNNEGKVAINSNIISALQYLSFMDLKDPNLATIVKKSTCFVYEKQSVIIDTIMNDPKQTFNVLRFELNDRQPKFPPFIKVIKEVTEDPAHALPTLAKQYFKKQ